MVHELLGRVKKARPYPFSDVTVPLLLSLDVLHARRDDD